MVAAQTAGYKIGELSRSGKKMADAHIISQQKYGYDGCVIDFDDATIAEALGAKVIFRENEPAVVNEEEPVLKDLRDIYTLQLPNPNQLGRIEEWLEATRLLTEKVGDRVFVMGRADQGPFSIACMLRGTTQFMMDLMTADEKLVHDVIDFCRQASFIFAKAQFEAGAHATSIGDALAGPNLISPDMYEQFAFRPEQQLAADVQALGIPYSVHICGNTNGIIGKMGEVGAQILEVDWMVDMKRARQMVPASTVLMGNIDPSYPLVNGTPTDVEQAVKHLIGQTKGYRHLISSGCAMGRNTPPENFVAFITAARKYGSRAAIEQLRESTNTTLL